MTGGDPHPPAAWRGRARGIAPRIVLIAFIAGGAWQPQPAVSAAPAVRFTAGEFFFAPKEVSAAPGEITFTIKNSGAIEHDFVVENSGGRRLAEIPVIEPGQTLEATATISGGSFTIYCSLPGHREAGMVARLLVR